MTFETDYSNSPLMSAIDDAARARLLAAGHRRSFPAGALIYGWGEPAESMMVIESGRAEVSLTSPGGRRSVLNHVGPGEVVGEVALLDRGTRSADVTAATEVTAVLLTRAMLMEFLKVQPEVTLAMIAEICAKVRNASDMFEAKSEINAPARLARCVLRIARKWGVPRDDGALVMSEPFSQSDLGEFSGLARENVNRHLRVWIDQGFVEYDVAERRLVLVHPAALEQIAET